METAESPLLRQKMEFWIWIFLFVSEFVLNEANLGKWKKEKDFDF